MNFDTEPADTGTITLDGASYSDGGSVSKNTGTYSLTANTATGYAFTRWDLFGLLSVADSNSPSTTLTISGTGTIKMVQTSTSPTTPAPRSGCIIATATYGNELAPEVVYMRHVRDNMIGSNEVGKAIVIGWNSFYYSWSPQVAQFIDTHDFVKPVFEVLLLPLVGTVHLTAIIYGAISLVNTPLASTVAFLIAALSTISIYVICPATTIRLIYRKANSSAS
jgi:hypothetical protein